MTWKQAVLDGTRLLAGGLAIALAAFLLIGGFVLFMMSVSFFVQVLVMIVVAWVIVVLIMKYSTEDEVK